MIETKVIDTKVKSLLTNVRNQAERYKELFAELEGLRDAITNDITNLHELSDTVEHKIDDEISDLKVKYENSIISVEEKISKMKQLEIDYDQIRDYKDNFELLLKKFEEDSSKFTQNYEEFILETHRKISDEGKSFRTFISKEIELESRTLESRIYDRIRKVDRHLDQYDKRIYESNKLQDETNSTIFKQMRLLEGYFDSIKSITESMARSFNTDLRNTESHILEKIDILEERQEKLKEIEFLDDILDLDQSIRTYKRQYEIDKDKTQKSISDFEKQISQLRGENKSLAEEINSNKSKTNIAIVTSVIAVVILLALVVMM